MKKSSIRWIGWILFFLVCYTPGKAQFSISKVTPREAEVQIKPGTIKPLGAFNNPFASEARMHAERRRIRKERNTFTMVLGLNLSQTKFENWAAGGANSFAGWASVQMTHIYVKDKIRLTTQFESKYGLNINSGKSFKNLDYFNLNFNAARSISKNWSYSASTNLRSQWSKGFRSATDKTMVSNILSPGYWTVGGGLTYQALKKVPLKLTLNPLSINMTMVLSDTLSKQGLAGVKPGRKQLTSFGGTARLDLNQPIAKGKFRYVTYCNYTTDYKHSNVVDWNNTLSVTITKLMAGTIFWRMIYNEQQPTPDHEPLQWNYSFGLGLTYTIKNK